MAVIANPTTGDHVLLRAEHVFGRNRLRADTHLCDTDISLLHAAARWRDGKWLLTNYGRNGTCVDDRALGSGEEIVLREGQRLRFGDGVFCNWQVIDLSAPGPALVPENNTGKPLILGKHQMLPLTGDQEVSLFQTRAGDWMLESAEGQRVLEAGDRVMIAGCPYQLVLVDAVDETARRASGYPSSDLLLRFELTTDEEHTHLCVRGSLDADLGERSHHYCLVTLARLRLRDASSHLPRASQGWVRCEELASMLGIDMPHLNIQIYRARHQLMSALPHETELSAIIERRSRRVRLGDFAFEIWRGAKLEGQYIPHPSQPELRSHGS